MLEPHCRACFPIEAILVQDSTFRLLRCHHRLSEVEVEFTLVRFPGSLQALQQWCSGFRSCIVIVDKGLLEGATRDSLEALLWSRAVRVLVAIDGTEAPLMLEQFLMLGCYGFLHYGTSIASLKRIIAGVNAGHMAVKRNLLSCAFQNLIFKRSPRNPSRRESEVLRLLGQRLTNKRIAERLYISEETLRWHLRNLYAKTRMRSRAELIQYAAAMLPPADVAKGHAATMLPPAAAEERLCAAAGRVMAASAEHADGVVEYGHVGSGRQRTAKLE